MRRAALLLALLLAAPLVAQNPGRAPLSRGLADSLYCALGGTCSIGTLTITGSCTGCTTGAVPTTRTVSTTSPLGGGGALSADLTLTCTTCTTTASKLSVFAATTSAELASVLSDESGSDGGFVRATGPAVTGLTSDTVQTSGNVGIGVAPNATAGRLLDLKTTTDTVTVLDVTASSAGTSNSFAIIRTNTDTSGGRLISYPSGYAGTFLGVTAGGYTGFDSGTGSGLLIGTTNASSQVRFGTAGVVAEIISSAQAVTFPVGTITVGAATTAPGTIAVAKGVGGGALWTMASGATANWTETSPATAPAQGGVAVYTDAAGQRGVVAAVATPAILMSGGANTVPAYKTPALAHALPANQTGNGTSTFKMNGLGAAGAPCTITPAATGRVVFTITGQLAQTTTLDGITTKLAFGTGSAPANAAAATGTVISATITHTALTGALEVPFAITASTTGLALSTAVWFDLQVANVTGGTAAITNVDCTAWEM